MTTNENDWEKKGIKKIEDELSKLSRKQHNWKVLMQHWCDNNKNRKQKIPMKSLAYNITVTIFRLPLLTAAQLFSVKATMKAKVALETNGELAAA